MRKRDLGRCGGAAEMEGVFGATVAVIAAVSPKGIEGRLSAAAKFPKA
jgi:hypothetical protein